MSKSVTEISEQAIRAAERVISNEVPIETCREKEVKAEWKREQARQLIIQKLQGVVQGPGPGEIKG